MKNATRLVLIAFCLLIVCSSALVAQMRCLETNDLRLVYFDNVSYLVPHLARCFENSFGFHRNLFQYAPSEKVTLFLHDANDFGSGGTTAMPWNLVSIGVEPFDYVFETMPTNERMNWLMNHELMHVVAYDKAANEDNFFRSLFFGKVAPTAENPMSMLYSYLTLPRRYVPRWYHEGIAVFMETWMAGGVGRVLGGYDEMVFRTMIRDSSYFYDIVGLEAEGTAIDFQIGQNSYLYGTRFVSYLAHEHGPEKMLTWFNRTNDSRRYYTSQFENVYGISLDEEWSKWIEWEKSWQQKNLDSINKFPVTPYKPILPAAVGSVSRAFFDLANNKLFTAINHPGQLAHIASIDVARGTIEKICDVTTPALYYVSSTAYDRLTDKLFFTTNNSQGWRDVNVVNVTTGQQEVLLRDSRIGDLAFDAVDKSLWGVRHNNGISSLVRIPYPYTSWKSVLVLPYGKDMFDLDIAPDGSSLSASSIEISGKQTLVLLNIQKLLNGMAKVEELYEFENNAPENFVFSADGKYLFGTSYYSGVSNVFRYDIENKKMDAVTNCETGFFRPVPYTKDSLIVFRYTGKGFLPVVIPAVPVNDVSAISYLGQEIVEKYPVVKSWRVGSPAAVNIDSLTVSEGKYNSLEHVRLASGYPIVEGYKNILAFGMRFNFMDPIGFNDLNISGLYSTNRSIPEDERVHLALNYRYVQWRVSASYNRSDFYDLFGPTKTSRKGYALSVQYNDFFLNRPPRIFEYTLSLAGYGGLERLPDFQNINASYDKFLVGTVKLNYTNYRFSLGAVDNEEGVKVQLISRTNYVNSEFIPLLYSTFDVGFMLPIDHSSIWLRNSLGYSFGERTNSFSYFFFGGFGNNWVDYAAVKRYREYYSFPGAELNSIGGLNYGKTMLEWTLPPLRFRRFGFTNLYCTWARLALFSSGIMTDVDNEAYRRTVFDAGGQVDFKLVIFSHLDTTLSFGFAEAFEQGETTSHEFMVSLKIL